MTALDRAAELLGDLAVAGFPIGPLTTYRVGGAARLFVEAGSLAALDAVAAAVSETGLPTLVVGNGSNLLVADTGFDGIAIRLSGALAEIDIDVNSATIVAGGAALLPMVARQSVQAGLSGFEWAVGVPGSIGGAVRMNAGGHGSDMAASLQSIQRLDLRTGNHETVDVADLSLGYRTSNLASSHVVVGATLVLAPGDPAVGDQTLKEIVRWRRANQPGGRNAGSVFTNPPDDSAGRLIDAAGGKGLRIGSASVSTKHANFIQSDEGGRAADVRSLMDALIELVAAHSGVILHPETRIVGFDDGFTPDHEESR